MDWPRFDLENVELLKARRFDEAERRLLELYAEAKGGDDLNLLDEVLGRLADHYSCPLSEDIPKAELFVSEREKLHPTTFNQLQSALFLMVTIGDMARALKKLDRIAGLCSEKPIDDPRSCFWATALRGICLLRLGRVDECAAIVQRLLDLAHSFGADIIPGDAIEFLKELVKSGRAPVETGVLLGILEHQSIGPKAKQRFSVLLSELAGDSSSRAE